MARSATDCGCTRLARCGWVRLGPSAGNVLVMSGPRGRLSLSTDRLAAFSGGVLAIAATLLVLEIAVHPPGTLLQQVLHAWPGSQQEDGEELQSAQRRLLPAVIGYVIAILIGLLVPRAAVTLYFFLAVYLIVPFGEMARLLFRRP
jgi:Endosomal/lysosomal potassium channel TMEM175